MWLCISSYMLYVYSIWSEVHLHGCNFKLDMNFSNFLRRMSSAPYFPCVPLSTSKKYACRLFNTANFDLLTSNWANNDKVCEIGWERRKNRIQKKCYTYDSNKCIVNESAEEPVHHKVNSQIWLLLLSFFYLSLSRVYQ